MFRIHRESRDDKKKEKIQRLISFPCEPRCPIALPVFYEGGEHVGQTKEIALLYTDIAVSCRLPQVEHSLVEILDLVLKQHLWHLLSKIRCDNLWNDLFHLESNLVSKTTSQNTSNLFLNFVFLLSPKKLVWFLLQFLLQASELRKEIIFRVRRIQNGKNKF